MLKVQTDICQIPKTHYLSAYLWLKKGRCYWHSPLMKNIKKREGAVQDDYFGVLIIISLKNIQD